MRKGPPLGTSRVSKPRSNDSNQHIPHSCNCKLTLLVAEALGVLHLHTTANKHQ